MIEGRNIVKKFGDRVLLDQFNLPLKMGSLFVSPELADLEKQLC